MITIIDGPGGKNDWAHILWDTDELWFEESETKKPFTTSDVLLLRGKYAGYKLSEVTDSWYLKFIRDKNLDDGLIVHTFNKRLGELKL